MLQLVASETINELQLNHESFQSLALALQLTPSFLENEIRALFADNVRALKNLDPRPRPH
jgi:glutamate-ammonia-ligase adenylyltransferase